MSFRERVALHEGVLRAVTDMIPNLLRLDLYVCERCGKAEFFH
ncbi:MAG: hypothetical protein AAF682_27745 [Planctomycetota bacterium]